VAISIQQSHVDEIIDHAQHDAPRECCGLIGGKSANTQTVYPLRNTATDPLVTYEASPEDLFAARGVQCSVLDDQECVALMKDFIQARPELWNEDIGVPGP